MPPLEDNNLRSAWRKKYMKKKLPSIILYCPKCKQTPHRDEKQSNKNWDVIPAICPTCKIRLKIKVE